MPPHFFEAEGVNAMILAWFTTPVPLTGWQQLLLLLPLCLAVSVVYKATKLHNLRDLPRASFVSWVTVVVGMFAVGGVLYALYGVMA